MEVFSFLPTIIVIILLSTVSSLLTQKRKAAETAGKRPKAPMPAAPQTPPPADPPEPEKEWRPERPLVVAPAAPKMGAEGEDDCHAYMLPPESAASESEFTRGPDETSQAQELLRGVILSEVLGRPDKRYRRHA